MDDDGPCATAKLLPLRPWRLALGQPVRFLLSGVRRDPQKTRPASSDEAELLAETETVSRLFDKEKTLREGSCLMELRAVPFRDVLLAC